MTYLHPMDDTTGFEEPEEDETRAWEYWHQRAIAADAASEYLRCSCGREFGINHERGWRVTKIVLSLCDRTGNMVRPWLDAGYEAITVDLREADSAAKGRHHFTTDVTTWRYPLRFGPPAMVFAFPPCTDLASSGARWFKDKGLRGLISALEIVDACRDLCETSGAPWMLENPVGTLATYWRKPDHTFHPCDFTAFELGDNYTKKTCLWTGGGFVMPPRSLSGGLGEPDDRIHRKSPSEDRADFRSATPMGFARAVFKANAPRLACVA